jgi:hypothetical protein
MPWLLFWKGTSGYEINTEKNTITLFFKKYDEWQVKIFVSDPYFKKYSGFRAG